VRYAGCGRSAAPIWPRRRRPPPPSPCRGWPPAPPRPPTPSWRSGPRRGWGESWCWRRWACGPAPRRVSEWWLGAGVVVGCAMPAVGGRRRRLGRGVGVPRRRHHVGAGRRRRPVRQHQAGVAAPAVGGGELVLAPLGVWPCPEACVGVVAWCGGGYGVRCVGCGRAAAPIRPRRRPPPPPSPCRGCPLAPPRPPTLSWRCCPHRGGGGSWCWRRWACGPAPRRASARRLGAGGVMRCAVSAVGGRRRRFGRGVGVSCHRHHVGGGRGRRAVFGHPVGVVSVSAVREVTVSPMLRQLPLLRFLLDLRCYRRV